MPSVASCKSSLTAFFGRGRPTDDCIGLLELLMVNLCLEVKLPFTQDFNIAVTTGHEFWPLIVSSAYLVS